MKSHEQVKVYEQERDEAADNHAMEPNMIATFRGSFKAGYDECRDKMQGEIDKLRKQFGKAVLQRDASVRSDYDQASLRGIDANKRIAELDAELSAILNPEGK